MNYLSPQTAAIKGALDESAPKKVSLYPNLGSPKAANNRAKTGRLSFKNGQDVMITAAQLRAARGLLDWTRADLAKAANISPETVKNIEHGTFRPQENTAEAIIKAFGIHNVEFTENEGVKFHNDTVMRYEGREQFKRFMDNIYEVVKKSGGSICISGVDEKLFQIHLEDYHLTHAKRMTELKNVEVRSLIREGDTNFVCSDYCDYRWVPAVHFHSVPFYVFGDKLAIIMFHEEAGVDVAVINSQIVAMAYREQFEMMWKDAILPPKRA